MFVNLKSRKVLIYAIFLLPFYSCSRTYNSENTGSSQTAFRVFVAGRYNSDPVASGEGPSPEVSSVFSLDYDPATNTFSAPTAWSDPFSPPPIAATTTSSSISVPTPPTPTNGTFTRKVLCPFDQFCLALGGYHSEAARSHGDYGGSISTTNNGMNWVNLATPFEGVNPNPGDPNLAHTSINDATCVGTRCLIAGVNSNTDGTLDPSDTGSYVPALGYTANVSTSSSFSILNIPYTVGTTPMPAPLASEAIGGSFLNKVYCFNAQKCFVLAEIASPLTRYTAPNNLTLKNRSIILKSNDMTTWTWDGLFQPANASPNYSTNLIDIACADSNNCFAVGQLYVDQDSPKSVYLSSTDGGSTWSSSELSLFDDQISDYLSTLDSVLDFSYATSISCSQTGSCLASVRYYGYPLQPGNQSALFVRNKTTGTWSMLPTPEPLTNDVNINQFSFTEVNCYNDKIWFLGGIYRNTVVNGDKKTGIFLYTTDAGATWTLINIPSVMSDAQSSSIVAQITHN